MGFKVSANEGNYENPTPGTKAARCIRIVDVGTQHVTWQGTEKLVPKLIMTWETDELMESGKPFVVQNEYTASIGERSNLGKHINSWLNKPLTEEERMGFDLFDLIGKTCMITIQHKTGKNNKTYVEVKAVIALPDAYPPPPAVNEPFTFTIEDDLNNEEKLKQLWGLERYKLRLSDEVKAAGVTIPDAPKKEESKNDGEEIPF